MYRCDEVFTLTVCTSEHASLNAVQGATRFSNSLTEAANSLHGGIELQKPEQQYVDSIELKAAAFSRAANDEAILQHFNEVRLLVLCTRKHA